MRVRCYTWVAWRCGGGGGLSVFGCGYGNVREEEKTKRR
jgi:hypothetical protein